MDAHVRGSYLMSLLAVVPLLHGLALIWDPIGLPGFLGDYRTAILFTLILAEPIAFGTAGIWLGLAAKRRGEPDGKPAAILAGLAVAGAIPVRFFLTGIRYGWFDQL